jgi:hypothetical protein
VYSCAPKPDVALSRLQKRFYRDAYSGVGLLPPKLSRKHGEEVPIPCEQCEMNISFLFA